MVFSYLRSGLSRSSTSASAGPTVAGSRSPRTTVNSLTPSLPAAYNPRLTSQATTGGGWRYCLTASVTNCVVREFGLHIVSNQQFIPDYGDRRRDRERISTGFVESTINQVLSKRFVTKQPMRWSPRGAHLLLQVRAQVLNGEYRKTLVRWYPGMKFAPRWRNKWRSTHSETLSKTGNENRTF